MAEMTVRLKNRGPNQTIVDFGDAGEVLFSYETPVAGRHPRAGTVRTTQFYSPTTSKHVNAYLGGVETQAVSQQFFDEWLGRIGDMTQVSPAGGANWKSYKAEGEAELGPFDDLRWCWSGE
jgi:hypothetical protein